MGYLISADYDRYIQSDNLTQVISNNPNILSSAELAAQAEITSYLTQKYDVSKEFRSITTFSDLVIYKGNNQVVYNNALYYVTLPHPEFNNRSFYSPGDQVFWKDKLYTCVLGTVIYSHETIIQYGQYDDLPLQNIFPDDPVLGPQYWGSGTPYSITGILPTDATKWTLGDIRDPQIVMFMVDITLYHTHARISPRNIPQLRVDRYDSAIAWLKMAAGGEITAALPIIQPRQGSRIRYGGNIKLQNGH